MITLDEWAEIRRLHRSEGLAIKAIARKLGISKNTVRRALRADEVPRYRRTPKGSIADAAQAIDGEIWPVHLRVKNSQTKEGDWYPLRDKIEARR